MNPGRSQQGGGRNLQGQFLFDGPPRLEHPFTCCYLPHMCPADIQQNEVPINIDAL